MKHLNKIINIILGSLCCVVASVFIFGYFKKTNISRFDSEKSVVYKTDQSSVSQNATNQKLNTQDELTDKYMKELQLKLKKSEREAASEIKKTNQYPNLKKPKDEDWSNVSSDQQISKENQFENRGTSSVSRPQGIPQFGGTQINKDNAAEFIETARKNGYYVELSNSFEVINVTPIMNTKGINDSFETNPEN